MGKEGEEPGRLWNWNEWGAGGMGSFHMETLSRMGIWKGWGGGVVHWSWTAGGLGWRR